MVLLTLSAALFCSGLRGWAALEHGLRGLRVQGLAERHSHEPAPEAREVREHPGRAVRAADPHLRKHGERVSLTRKNDYNTLKRTGTARFNRQNVKAAVGT